MPTTRIEAAVAELVAAIREEISAPAGPPPPTRLLSVEQAAEVLGVSRTMVYALMGQGRLRRLKLGRRVLIPATAIDELIE
jgi:excisionase family DNA binding protein